MASRRIPSPKVMAAKLLEVALEGPYFRTADDLTALFGTKVSEAKREKVVAYLDALSRKFRARVRTLSSNYDRPPPRRKKGQSDAR